MNVWKRVVAAALLDFTAYQIIHASSGAPPAVLLKEWADKHGIPLDDPDTEQWQEALS